MLTLHARTNIPLSSARLRTFFQQPLKITKKIPRRDIRISIVLKSHQTQMFSTNVKLLGRKGKKCGNFQRKENSHWHI